MKFLKTKEFQFKLLKNFILFVYLPLGVLVALLAPDNILDYQWARIYTDFMASWLPYVAEVGRWTKIPATQFIAAVMNTVAILLSISLIYVALRHDLEGVIKRLREASRKDKIIMFLGIPFFSVCSYVLLFLAPLDNRRGRVMIGSNIGMGFYGSLIIASVWLCIAMVIVIIIAFWVMMQRSLMLKQDR